MMKNRGSHSAHSGRMAGNPLPNRVTSELPVIQEERLTNLNEPSLNSELNC
jgi:hypothetical protein